MYQRLLVAGLVVGCGAPERKAASMPAAPAAAGCAEQIVVIDHGSEHTACAADRRLDPLRDPLTLPAAGSGEPTFDSPRAALAWLDAEYDGLLSAVRYAENAGFHRHAWQLAWALVYILDQRGNWHAEVDVRARRVRRDHARTA